MTRNPYASPFDRQRRKVVPVGTPDYFGLGASLLLMLQPVVILVLLSVNPVYHGPAPPPVTSSARLLGAGCLLELVIAPFVLLALGAASVYRWQQQRRFRLGGLIALIVSVGTMSLLIVNLLFAQKI